MITQTMRKKKIVFVFNAIITRCVKRVEEFIEQGYEADVYAFSRGSTPYVQPQNFKINIIGEHDVSMSYLERAFIIRKSLSQLFKRYQHEDVIYYFFFFDVASIGYLMCKKSYIYEESDIPYTNITNKIVRNMMAYIDRQIIKKSFLTTITSEGFIEYHYGEEHPDNIIVVPNRVNERLTDYPYNESILDESHLRFSFVGGFRYLSTLNFIKFGAKNYPQHTFSVYGNIMNYEEELRKLAKEHANVFINGMFKNPEDLPKIYEKTDIVLANYDASSINAQYAEPNKMYESIYFHTPIVVSSGTFLARKVARLGIGYDVDSNRESSVCSLIEKLSKDSIIECQQNAKRLPLDYSINRNPQLFEYLRNKN